MDNHNKHCPAMERVVLILRKRWIPLLLLSVFLLSCLPARAEEEDGPAAMILYEPRTGTVLEALNPDTPMLIASTTKIMTALVVLEHCGLNETVTVTAEQTAVEGSSAWLMAGASYTVEDLLYGLMLASGNDAACALAEYTAGSIEGFAALMNEKAAALELRNTHFSNPHGLNDPEHYSSARDLALLTAAAMENAVFARIFAARSYSAHGLEYSNHNKLLDTCEGCIGGKTGFTKAAGRTLVSCAERGDLRLICVSLNDPNDWDDHCSWYDEAFSSFDFIPFPSEWWERLPVISGEAPTVALRCNSPGVLVRRGVGVKTLVELPRFLFAPVAAGDCIGTVTVSENGDVVGSAEIFTVSSVPRDEDEEMMPWKRFWKNWQKRCAVTLIVKY